MLVSRYSLISLDSLAVVSTLSDAFFLGKNGPFSIEVLQTDLLILTVEQGSWPFPLVFVIFASKLFTESMF